MKIAANILQLVALCTTTWVCIPLVSSATTVGVEQLRLHVEEEKNDKAIVYKELFDDELWRAAMKSLKGGPKKVKTNLRQGDVESIDEGADSKPTIPEDSPDETEEEIPDQSDVEMPEMRVIPPQPKMPSRFAFAGVINAAFGGEESLFDNQPLFYTFAVDGNDASITSDGTTLYYQLDDFACTPNETESRSFIIGNFEVFDGTSDAPNTDRLCWRAAPGTIVNEGYLPKYKLLLQLWLLGDLFEIPWLYGGVTQSLVGPVHLWTRQTLSEAGSYSSTAASTVLASLVSDGSVIYYQTRFSPAVAGVEFDPEDLLSNPGATVKVDIAAFQTYDDDEEVPNAVVDPAIIDTCGVMQNGYNTGPCEMVQDEDALIAASNAFEENAYARGTGFDPDAPRNYPSAEMPYEIIGDQEMVMNLPFFVPPMNDRPYMPVRNQGGCGSCYSYSAVTAISSAYAQANPGTSFVFSNQQVMNCMPLSSGEIEENVVTYIDSGLGCWGGNQDQVFDWLVATGSELPLITTVSYLGAKGTCNTTLDMVQTGVTGYSTLKSVEEMKNALYYRGDIAISLQFGGPWYADFTNQVSWPFFLGVGMSGEPLPSNHAIAVIGWGRFLFFLGLVVPHVYMMFPLNLLLTFLTT